MLADFVNERYCDPQSLRQTYESADPFPHIVMTDFLNRAVIDEVADAFPMLENFGDGDVQEFRGNHEIKRAMDKYELMPTPIRNLFAFLNSAEFLRYLQALTGIEEELVSDPYLQGGGLHQIRRGGFLKVHADFNYHPTLKLDRRLNVLIYLNKDWEESWGGDLQLWDKTMSRRAQQVFPHINTCVVFSTTSSSFHGHPDKLECPEDRIRRSLALYYYSNGRPEHENEDEHTTIFKSRPGEKYTVPWSGRSLVRELVPPLVMRAIDRVRHRGK